MLLAVAMLAGCASAPRQLPRATASDLASADDKSVCLAGNLYPNTHADAHIVKAEYMKRLNGGRFTHQQCAQFYAGVMRNKQQSEAESAAAWSDVAYQLGQTIGSRGRVMSTYPPTPTAAPTPPSKPYTPTAPFVPTPYVPSYTLLSATPSNVPEAGYFMTTCRYVGSTTVIRVQTGTACPASVPQ